jgi:hypothetical protein
VRLGRRGRPEAGRGDPTARPWFHDLHLPDGVQSAPDHPVNDFAAGEWAEIAPQLPIDLIDWPVLDIGCNGGFYALSSRGEVRGFTRLDHKIHLCSPTRPATRAWAQEEWLAATGRGRTLRKSRAAGQSGPTQSSLSAACTS